MEMIENRLTITIEATQEALRRLLDDAAHPAVAPSQPRDRYARIDAFLAVAARHLAAVDEALLGVVVQRMPDGPGRVKTYLHQARLLEQAMALLKARLYGEVHAAPYSWAQVWDDVRCEFVRHNDLEASLVEDLVAAVGPAEASGLADALYRAEIKAPTRTHPYIPHRGLLGHVARRVWAVADHFWDDAEGRMVPKPVGAPKKEHRHDSLVAQYLVGEPRFDPDAPLFEHRHRR
jgi:hypothetical protein